jgi:ectoine hydroxylase-related dioxygenase (phytanoyl-CoA dioxygenase family)
MARNTSIGHKLAGNEKIQSFANALLNNSSAEKNKLIISGPSFFINIPHNFERKYTWHSEQNWYPKRRKFLNIWCPVFNDRTNDDSMAVMPGSHKKDWFYFSEYTGYEGKIDETANVQYEIPSSFLEEYKPYIPSVKVGEGLFFNGKLVHRSLDNISKKPQFTIVFRVFDYSQDLTLSSNWADIPYNRKSIGIPEINVNP